MKLKKKMFLIIIQENMPEIEKDIPLYEKGTSCIQGQSHNG